MYGENEIKGWKKYASKCLLLNSVALGGYDAMEQRRQIDRLKNFWMSMTKM